MILAERFGSPGRREDHPAGKELAERTCRTAVELAHHGYLREPNQAKFDKVPRRVIRFSKDRDAVDRAKRCLQEEETGLLQDRRNPETMFGADCPHLSPRRNARDPFHVDCLIH